VNVSATVFYGTRPARFVNQMMVMPDTFAAPGDSGSLVVTASGHNPVGLHFAGSPAATLENPYQSVLAQLGITPVGTAVPMVQDAASVDGGLAAVAGVKRRYGDFLFGLPEVVGHGVGYSRTELGQPVILLFVKKATSIARQAAPKLVEGVPVELVETGESQAQ
jgi:hypothetical protein